MTLLSLSFMLFREMWFIECSCIAWLLHFLQQLIHAKVYSYIYVLSALGSCARSTGEKSDNASCFFFFVSFLATVPVRVQTSDPTMTFRGFVVQSRQSTPTFSNDADSLGSFTNAPSGGDWQLWNCPSTPVSTYSAVSHSSP